MKREILAKSRPIDDELSKDFISIMSTVDKDEIPPFMKFVLEEQQNYLSSSTNGVRYHHMIIRYCLNLASKSPSFYDNIRYDKINDTGFLVLPSRRRLRDYKNYIHPTSGFNNEINAELTRTVENFSEQEEYCVLLMDEMKIQEDLVWDKHTGDLIGYMNLSDSQLNYATLKSLMI